MSSKKEVLLFFWTLFPALNVISNAPFTAFLDGSIYFLSKIVRKTERLTFLTNCGAELVQKRNTKITKMNCSKSGVFTLNQSV